MLVTIGESMKDKSLPLAVGRHAEILNSPGMWGGMIAAVYPSGIALIVTLDSPAADSMWVKQEDIRVHSDKELKDPVLQLMREHRRRLGLPEDLS